MVITIEIYKGGVGKSTTAIHLAAYFQEQAPTLLVDTDPNQSVIQWSDSNTEDRGFRTITGDEMAMQVPNFTNIILDTPARPEKSLLGLVKGSDLVILPCFPDMFSLRTLLLAKEALANLNSNKFKVLLTNVPPAPQKDGDLAREQLEKLGYPIFKAQIRSAKAFKRAAIRGVTVRQVRDDERSYGAWTDYENVGHEIDEFIKAHQH